MVASDISYSVRLRELAKDFYQNHIQLEQYRAQRKIILDKIDEEFNGRKVEAKEDEENQHMNTVAFFNNNDVD